jgi:hypothetical protein
VDAMTITEYQLEQWRKEAYKQHFDKFFVDRRRLDTGTIDCDDDYDEN